MKFVNRLTIGIINIILFLSVLVPSSICYFTSMQNEKFILVNLLGENIFVNSIYVGPLITVLLIFCILLETLSIIKELRNRSSNKG